MCLKWFKKNTATVTEETQVTEESLASEEIVEEDDMTFVDFINEYLGKKVDYDKFYGFQCFTKGHCVLMADWTYKPIEEVQVGDEVIGYDNKINKVTNTFKSDKEVVHIRTDLSDLFVTPDHPFYFKDGKFREATCLNDYKPSLFSKENFEESGLTDNELRFLGFWLGDGNISKHNDNRTDEIHVTYGLKKVDYVHSLDIVSAEKLHHDTDQAYVASIRKREHPILTDIILNKCAKGVKQLPLIFTNREYELIIEGFIHADGSPHHNSYTITNTSIPLLLSIQAACIMIGYTTKTLRPVRRSSEYIKIKGKLVKSVKPLYRLILAENSKAIMKTRAEFLEKKVETVYNIQTDGSHTYICNNYKVHNCTDLFRQYCNDVLKIEHTGGVEGAKDLYQKYKYLPKEQKYFDRLAVNETEFKFGDVILWDATQSNPYGHVAIFVSNCGSDMVVFEQNGYAQDGAKLVIRSYTNCLGCLRMKA